MSTKKTNKGWKKFAFDRCDEVPKSGIKETSRLNHASTKINKFDFERQITPKVMDDLAVHIRKINDIQFWLQNNVLLPAKKSTILLLTGPTGCGKSITIKVLCKKMDIEIMEWINPIDKDRDFMIGQTNQLLEFVSASKYPSLFCMNKPQITLIEDFPNSVIHDPSQFVSVLDKCSENKSSVIFICTDSNSNLNLAQTLFPQDVRDKYSIYNINFNATATTLLKKALKRAQNLIQEHSNACIIPNESILDNIIQSSMGDIRCAINQLYFTCLKESDLKYETITSKKPKRNNKRKRNDKSITKIETMMKNERLSFFHGLGRVLNPKRENVNGSWRLHCDVNALVEELGIQPTTFNSFVHANYLKYFGDVIDICNAAEILSLSQDYLSKWDYRTDLLKYGLWLSVMGLMVYNEHRVSKWNQITGPRKFAKNTTINLETRSMDAIDRFYYNILNKCDNSKKVMY